MGKRRKTGTHEWAGKTVNLQTGCERGCLYCYAREMALRFKRIKSGHEWGGCSPTIYGLDAATLDRRYPGVVMFPSAHDVTARNLPYCVHALSRLLAAGNRVLAVSKPDVAVWRTLLEDLAPYKSQVELRFTIGGLSPAAYLFWETAAPSFEERLEALAVACRGGWRTSVSCEPLLEPWRAAELVAKVRPMAETVWIGAARDLRRRTAWCEGAPGLVERISELEVWQAPGKMRGIYDALKGDPKVRWKDSYQAALGLDGPGGV